MNIGYMLYGVLCAESCPERTRSSSLCPSSRRGRKLGLGRHGPSRQSELPL